MADTSLSVLGDLAPSVVVPMTLDDLPDILTVREAAAYLRIGLNSATA